jgi:hypothetical protein
MVSGSFSLLLLQSTDLIPLGGILPWIARQSLLFLVEYKTFTDLILPGCILSRISYHTRDERKTERIDVSGLFLSCIARQTVGAVAGLLFLAHHGVWLST